MALVRLIYLSIPYHDIVLANSLDRDSFADENIEQDIAQGGASSHYNLVFLIHQIVVSNGDSYLDFLLCCQFQVDCSQTSLRIGILKMSFLLLLTVDLSVPDYTSFL